VSRIGLDFDEPKLYLLVWGSLELIGRAGPGNVPVLKERSPIRWRKKKQAREPP
jgi:hypothetical protein